MKYPYVMGERTPARTAQEFKDLFNCSEVAPLKKSFGAYLKRYYPDVWKSYWDIWEVEIFFMRWHHKQSDFMIAIVNRRSHSIVGLYPTFKKAALALRAVFKIDKSLFRCSFPTLVSNEEAEGSVIY